MDTQHIIMTVVNAVSFIVMIIAALNIYILGMFRSRVLVPWRAQNNLNDTLFAMPGINPQLLRKCVDDSIAYGELCNHLDKMKWWRRGWALWHYDDVRLWALIGKQPPGPAEAPLRLVRGGTPPTKGA